MSTKLDLPLEDIVKTQRGMRRRGSGRSRRVGKPTSASAGGVVKNSKINKAVKATSNNKGTAAVASIPTIGDSKIVVSGLPTDVSEQQIKVC